jgi:hypothetical protein
MSSRLSIRSIYSALSWTAVILGPKTKTRTLMAMMTSRTINSFSPNFTCPFYSQMNIFQNMQTRPLPAIVALFWTSGSWSLCWQLVIRVE